MSRACWSRRNESEEDNMGHSLLDKTDENIVAVFRLLERITAGLDSCRNRRRELLGGEVYLTDKELSEHLRISRRTLQDYRSTGKIPYYLVCGKILYKQSQIVKMIDDGYWKPFDDYM